LGAYEGGVFESRIVKLMNGDTLFLYTDGVTDVGVDRLSLLGTSGVKTIIESTGINDSCSDIIDAVRSKVESYANGNQRDDICMLALQVNTIMNDSNLNPSTNEIIEEVLRLPSVTVKV
jgi:serine phosphatase RsbU (regulator of sigma subunit)